MSTPPEHAPTEPQPTVTPPARPARTSRFSGDGYDPVARIALVVIAACMVIFLLLALTGYHFNVSSDKGKDKDKGGGKSPRVTRSANP